MHSNAIMAFLRKCVGQQWYPFIYMDLSLILCTHLSIGNPLITDAEKHFMTALLLATFKNKYVRPKKINYMFLRHFFLENDAGGRLFIFNFFLMKC